MLLVLCLHLSLSLVAIDCAKKGGKDSDAYVSIVKKSRWRYFFFVASLVRTAVSCETPRSPQDIARHVTELLLTVVYDNLRRRMPRNTLRVKISRERVSPPNRRKLSSKLVFLLIIKASHIQINSFWRRDPPDVFMFNDGADDGRMSSARLLSRGLMLVIEFQGNAGISRTLTKQTEAKLMIKERLDETIKNLDV